MLPALACLVAGPHSNNISWSLSWLLAHGAGRGGRGKEGCKLVPQAVVARRWQVEEQE